MSLSAAVMFLPGMPECTVPPPLMTSEAPFSVRDRKLLMQRIQDLGETEHAEIFNMLSAGGVDHTRNSNGVFINLTSVPDALVGKVNRFVTFCHSNKASLDEYDKRLNECKYSNNYANDAAAAAAGVKAGGQAAAGEEVVPPPLSPLLTHDSAPAAPPQATQEQRQQKQKQQQQQQQVVWDAAGVDKKAENAKFTQAKKKYAKRRVPDKKAEALSDLTSNTLTPELYLL